MPRHAGLGAEHPYCDRIRPVMIVLFFVVWGVDSLSSLILAYSTVISQLAYFPLRLPLAIAVVSFSLYLIAKSHAVVFGEANEETKLIDAGVYSWVRHPMYLGTLLFCLAFFIAMPSLLSCAVWVAFFIFYDKMADYEERDLTRILGEEYTNYQKRVPKWFPRPRLESQAAS